MPNVLITGANRGIGLGLAKLYARDDWTVFAGARDPSTADDLMRVDGNVIILPLDVADPAAVAILSERLRGVEIDMLIANAGIYGPRDLKIGGLDYAAWTDVLAVNTLGPIRVAEAFLDHVRQSEEGKIVALSSIMGSIESNASGGEYIYRSSKAALNAAMTSLAIDLRDERITVAMFHPGWVRTDMGGPSASVSIDESVEGLYRAISDLTLADSGAFLDFEGNRLPW